MVSLKLLVLLTVLSVAIACLPQPGKPKTDCECHKKEPVNTGSGSKLPILGSILKPKPEKHSWTCLGSIIVSIGDVVKESKNILREICQLDVAAALDDILDVVVRLGRALGYIIDILLPGLGGLFGRCVIAITQIIICIVGNADSPLRLGGLLGSKKCTKQPCCGAEYGCKWGWKRYDGKWDSHKNLLRHYELNDPSVELDLIIKKCTNGRGVVSLDLVSKLLYDHILILVKITGKSSSSWCKDDLITIYISVVTITGLLGNSCKPGLGVQLVDEIEAFCYSHFKKNGYKDIKEYNSEIKKKIERVKCWRWRGVVISDEAKESKISEDTYCESDETKESRTENDRSNENKQTRQSDSSDCNDSKQRTDKTSEEVRKSQAEPNQYCDTQSRTDTCSDNSQKSKDTSADCSDDNVKRGRITTEQASTSEKESKECSSKDANQASNLEVEQTKIDLKDGTITDTKVKQTNSKSEQEQKCAASSEKQSSVSKTVVDTC